MIRTRPSRPSGPALPDPAPRDPGLRPRAPTVFGQSFPAPRLTRLGATLIALALALPVGLILAVADLIW